MSGPTRELSSWIALLALTAALASCESAPDAKKEAPPPPAHRSSWAEGIPPPLLIAEATPPPPKDKPPATSTGSKPATPASGTGTKPATTSGTGAGTASTGTTGTPAGTSGTSGGTKTATPPGTSGGTQAPGTGSKPPATGSGGGKPAGPPPPPLPKISLPSKPDERKDLDKTSGYVVAWEVAGPCRQDGKGCQELFDIEFPPERTDAPANLWTPYPANGFDGKFAPATDFLRVPALKVDNCVVYLRTRIFAPQAQNVRLDVCSDDGVKVWLNGKVIHGNNALRGITSNADKVPTALRENWNDLRLKITQNNGMFGAYLRVVSPEGAPLKGLKADPQGK